MTARPKSARIETGTPIATQKAINLALQGGGSHSAFTWGVLDRLLEDERLTFDGITATSAGTDVLGDSPSGPLDVAEALQC